MSNLRIDKVIEELDRVLERAWDEEDRIGYFAALYRRVTVKVREGILTHGVFDDPERMDRLDEVFAHRFLDALAAWQEGRPTSRCWEKAFEGARSWRPIILQQLVLGINAHINLDLGLAAARISPGDEIADLHHDFNQINAILYGLVNLVERQVGQVSPWLGLLFRVAGEDGVRAVEFSLSVARVEAWRFAEKLAPVPEPGQAPLIERKDREATDLARLVLHPGWLIDAALLIIRARESHDVRHVIDVLSEETAHVTELVDLAEEA